MTGKTQGNYLKSLEKNTGIRYKITEKPVK